MSNINNKSNTKQQESLNDDHKQIDVVTFGCRLNIYESEIIRSNLEKSGQKHVTVFNTCAVTSEAQKQARQAIRKLKKENPNQQIIVTGCAAQTDPSSFAKMDQVDKVIGNEEKLSAKYYQIDKNTEITDSEKIQVNDIMSIKETSNHLIESFDGKARAFIQVQNGCDHRCTFCIIPYGRGNSRSVPIGVITKQVKLLLEQNYQEIVLTGVDVTAYGPDLPGRPTFAQMIRRLLQQVPNLQRLRLSSIDVAEIDEELFELMATDNRIMPHFHISLQAGDDMVLKRMKRRHLRQQILDFCVKMRSRRPDVAFGADIIAGFPTETEEMFENTRALISQAGLQYLHVFPYSARENTPAAKMPQVDMFSRKRRAKILRQEGDIQLQKFYRANIGQIHNILIEKDNSGHSENFIPVEFDESYDLKSGSIIMAKLIEIRGQKVLAVPVDKQHLVKEYAN